ncbi:ABC-type transport auxiliary lipoprotein family protein [Rhodoferax sp.]|uniref:ABC-type transport auxiliary lipoprotein family protein n=1 Tax=Rhodoferax sp. TaxID=50421 RepID=UPI0039B8F832
MIATDCAARSHRRMALVTLLLGMTAALGGCALADKPQRADIYDFGPGDTFGQRTTNPLAAALAPLALAEVEANPALDSTAVVYRLAYDNVQQLRPYAQARWSMPPAQLVRQRLRSQLGLRRAVLNPGEGVAANTKAPGADLGMRLLRVELEEFSQVFESATRSTGLVRLRATLVLPAAAGERLLAQREFTLQRPAPSLDAAGGVRALTLATDAAVHELDQWLQQVASSVPN